MAAEIIELHKINEVFYKVICDMGIAYDLEEHFSFMADNFRYNPKFKRKQWDGRIRLFSVSRGCKLYSGLLDQFEDFCKERNYQIKRFDKFENEIQKEEKEQFPTSLIDEWLKDIKITNEQKEEISPRDYQIKALSHIFSKKKMLALSATSSGKSLIIYLTTLKILQQSINNKVMIIVPSINLVNQLYSDFSDYSQEYDGFDIGRVKKIYGAVQDKWNLAGVSVVISTWQSLSKYANDDSNSKNWFATFNALLLDEAHTAQAKEITNIAEKFTNAEYRVGFTGTLKDMKSNILTVTALFGEPINIIKTKELIKRGEAAQLEIVVANLKYPNEFNAYMMKKLSSLKAEAYQEEIKFITKNPKRTDFIVQSALSMNKTTLILFQHIDHGRTIESALKKKTNYPVYFVDGSLKGEEREAIRKNAEKETCSLYFGETRIIIPVDEDVPLSNGKTKKAKNITTDDDIGDKWIKNKIS